MAGEVARRVGLLIAVGLCQAYVILRALEVELAKGWDMALKGLPVLVLAFVALTGEVEESNVPSVRGKVFSNRVGVGLALCSFGDIALEVEDGFLAGLSFFLLGHLFYCAAFSMDSSDGIRKRYGSLALALSYLMLMAWASAVALLHSDLVKYLPDEYKVPVTLYVCVIALMVYRAVGRYEPSCGSTSYNYSAVGAILFAASDMLLAYRKFAGKFVAMGPMVMFLYYAGQVSLCTSTIFPHPPADLLNKITDGAGSSTKPSKASPSSSNTIAKVSIRNSKKKKKRA